MPAHRFILLDRIVEVGADDPQLFDGVFALCGTFAPSSEAPAHRFVLDRMPRPRVILDGELRYEGETIEDVLAAFELDLYDLILLSPPDGIVLHAGAVTWNEQTHLFIGSSGAGKSSLTLQLLGHGARYVTDEWVFIDEQDMVSGVCRPLQLDEDNPAPRPPGATEHRLTCRAASGETTVRRAIHPPWQHLSHEAHPLGQVFVLGEHRGSGLEPVGTRELLVQLDEQLVSVGTRSLGALATILGNQGPALLRAESPVAAAEAVMERLLAV